MSNYNGWTNWETWNANLWLENDWQMAESFAMQAGDLLGSYDKDEAIERLTGRIEEFFNDQMPESISGFFNDVICMAMREVNFVEIATKYVEEFQDEDETEES